jgi:60 kDa SS-A/Ro ribonucleoprotein
MRRVGTLIERGSRTYAEAPTKNYQGFPSFEAGLEERCLQVMTTGVFADTFYVSSKELVKEALDLFEQMAQKDATLFAKMIVFARTRGLLRTVPVTALVILSKHSPENFRAAYPLVIRTPNDMRDFTLLVRKGNMRKGLGRALKGATGRWLNGISEYHVIKYGSKGSSEITLRDILRIVRPKPANAKQQLLFNYVVHGLTPENSARIQKELPQIWAMECLKRAESVESQLHFIAEGRLPYETVVGCVKPSAALWTALMRQMPFMALVRHLNTLQEAGVFGLRENTNYAVERLTKAEAVRKSMILPFQLFTAHKSVNANMPRAITEALETALELSFANMPVMEGVTCIAPDVSGSMSCASVDKRGTTRPIDIAAIFAAAALRQSADGIVLPFEGKVVDVRLSSRDTLMTTAQRLAAVGGGSTAVCAPVERLIERRTHVDTFIAFTDNIEWVGHGFLDAWRRYTKQVNKDAKAFLVTLMPYAHRMTPQHEPGVFHVYGWSPSVMNYIIETAVGTTAQLEAVRNIPLGDSGLGVSELPDTDDTGE